MRPTGPLLPATSHIVIVIRLHCSCNSNGNRDTGHCNSNIIVIANSIFTSISNSNIILFSVIDPNPVRYVVV